MKQVMKRFIASITFALVALVGKTAQAGIPVVDSANLAQAVQQVLAWQQQYQQMVQQYQQLQQQYSSITGSRGLGNVLNNPALQGVVPGDIASVYNSIQQGNPGALTGGAQSLRNATKIYDCQDRTGSDWKTCQAFLNGNSQTIATAGGALDLLNIRIEQIKGLQDLINTTNDPKSIAELQARMAAEQAQVSNDTSRVQLFQALAAAQDRAAQQAIKERELKNIAIKSNGTDTFNYQPPQ